jgi:hypothetical protein
MNVGCKGGDIRQHHSTPYVALWTLSDRQRSVSVARHMVVSCHAEGGWYGGGGLMTHSPADPTLGGVAIVSKRTRSA